MFKKAFTGEGMSLMKVSGSGDVFLAQDADEIFILHLEDESVTVSGTNVLAFESSLTWDINRVEGASMLSGGLFNTTFTGTGALAVTVYGTPGRPERRRAHLRRHAGGRAVVDVAEVDDPQDRQARCRRSAAGPARPTSSGSTGQGFVVVQASEGHPVVNQG